MKWPDIDFLRCEKCERRTTHTTSDHKCKVCKTKRSKP